MTAPLYLPVFFGLLSIGWLLGRHHDRIVAWLLRQLADDPTPASIHPLAWRHPSTTPETRSNVTVLHPGSRADSGGGAA